MWPAAVRAGATRLVATLVTPLHKLAGMSSSTTSSVRLPRTTAMGVVAALIVGAASSLVACSDGGSSGQLAYWKGNGDPRGGRTAPSEDGDDTSQAADPGSGSTGSGGGSGTTPIGGTPGGSGNGSGASQTPGNNNNNSDPPAPAPAGSFAVMTSANAAAIDLLTSTELMVTVAPTNFTGAVTLSVDNLPADTTAVFEPATLNVSGMAGATAKLTLTATSKVKPAAYNLNVTAKSGALSQQAVFALTVRPELTLRIPLNAMKGDPNMFGAPEYVITAPDNFGANAPITLKILNADTTPHIIHGPGSDGFFHGNTGTPLQQNQADQPRRLTAKRIYNFYLHDQGTPNTGRIVIQ